MWLLSYAEREAAVDPLANLAIDQDRLSIDETKRYIDRLANEYFSSRNNVGLVVGIVKNGGSHVFAYGRVAKDSDKVPDGDTIFEIASVGKTFTATILADMPGLYSTVYTRRAFTLHEVQSVTRIAVRYDYDDGFAVYLNGTRIFDQFAPATITNTSLATSSHEATHVFAVQTITTPSILALLQEGTNVLAVVGLNQTLASNDVTLRIELEVTGGADFPVDVANPGGESGDTVFPNPFVREAQFHFALQNSGEARLELFDVRGRRIRTVLAPRLAAGKQVVAWDGRDARGDGVAPGLYFYRLVTPERVQRGKVVRNGP
jgi:hypothetical protein